MAIIKWSETGKKFYETGVKKGVLYPMAGDGTFTNGVAWNGLLGVTESPSGAEPTPLYADDTQYITLMSKEEFGATIEAYTYPDEFGVCDGSASLSSGVLIGQQSRKQFGLSYVTTIGNDVAGDSLGYKIHLIYGSLASPSEKGYKTINNSPEAITFSWEISTTPVTVPGFKPTASLTIDSTKVDPTKLAALELILYGNTGVEPRLPFPTEIATIFQSAAPAALSLGTSVPADAATGIAVGSNITLTFNNKILEENVFLATAAGVTIPAVKTFDAAGKVLTIDPTANLTAATQYIICVGGVYDVHSQTMSPVIRKFTTA